MTMKADFTMKLEPGLDRQPYEYDEYLRRKVEAGRASMRIGRGRSNHEVEAAFAARRRQAAVGQT